MPGFVRNIPEVQVNNNNYDIHWNSNTGQVFNKTNDLVATNIRSQNGLGLIVDRRQLIDAIYELSKVPNSYIEGRLGSTESKTHKVGEYVNYSLQGVNKPHLYQFNIAGNGTIQCFQKVTSGHNAYRFKTTTPIGNDTLVSIAVSESTPSLDNLIGSPRQCVSNPSLLVKGLPKILKGIRYQINHVDIYVER